MADLWQPIETAPKDGRTIWVFVPDRSIIAPAWFCEKTGLWPHDYDDAYGEDGEPCNVGLPALWQPYIIPAPPELKGE